tara:strand:- start:1866 stop:2051 length:186 start_codon:yes stop_codon:yes gene_type:complete
MVSDPTFLHYPIIGEEAFTPHPKMWRNSWVPFTKVVAGVVAVVEVKDLGAKCMTQSAPCVE